MQKMNCKCGYHWDVGVKQVIVFRFAVQETGGNWYLKLGSIGFMLRTSTMAI